MDDIIIIVMYLVIIKYKLVKINLS